MKPCPNCGFADFQGRCARCDYQGDGSEKGPVVEVPAVDDPSASAWEKTLVRW